jgi:uncharacterized repeat protein (TIGR01451 family)/fimbrial isopeptide formation D2 family protein
MAHSILDSSFGVPSRLPRSTRRIFSVMALACGLIGALLFAFRSSSIAAPNATTLNQRIQNAAGTTSSTTITGTYGEALTTTMRFTITDGTVMTGPIRLTTRFAGVTGVANTQLGFRFLDYQGPFTAAAGTPPLNLTSFVSSTSGTAPNITTILTWTFDTITNTSGSSYAYEVPYQVRFVWDGVADSGTSAGIPNLANQTTLSWTGGSAIANGLTINLVKPDLGSNYSTQVYRVSPGIQGGATVAYTITLKNGNNLANFSAAYDLAVTDTLDSRLTYVSAYPPPTAISSVPGQNTIITWTTPSWSLAPNSTWTAYLTATLPPTLAANTSYANVIAPSYTTRPDAAPDEASYSSAITATFAGGIAGSKQVTPSDNVRIGDSVTYTVRITVEQDVYLLSPVFTDTLPLGFHYRAGSLNLSGDATLNGSPVTTTAGANELLSWQLNNLLAPSAKRYFTISYIADVNGIDSNGSAAYTSSAGQFTSKQAAANPTQAAWQDDSGNRLGLLAALASTTQIAQPYLNNTDFGVGIFGWNPITASQEIGSQVVYTLSVKNTGTITGYEVVLADQLPPGLVYQGNLVIQPTNLELWGQPTVGDTGLIQFSLKELPANVKAILSFNALVDNTARPGDTLVNQLNLVDYSSQPRGQYDDNQNDNDYSGIYDRHYSSFPIAMPSPKTAAFLARGLTAIKTDSPDPVLPGQQLVYSIYYSNTSAIFTASNVRLVDAYDPLLTYVGSTSAPDINGTLLHDPIAHTLTWNAGTLGPNPGASSRITATFQVVTGISRTVRVLTNTITSDSDSPAPAVTRIVTTALVQPKPTITLDDKGVSVNANSVMTYTMIYTNASGATGATTGTFTITLDYAPYITFITSTNRFPVPDTNGTIFTDTLGPGISRTVFLRMQVARPLPYALTLFTSTATIYQPEVDISDSESESTSVVLPVFDLVKVNTTPGNPPVREGYPIGYRIYVTNTGAVTGTNIVVTDVWDANTYNQNPSSNWTLLSDRGVYTTIATLAPGASVTLDPLNMNVTATLPSNAQLIHNDVLLTSRETTQQSTGYDTPIVGLFIQKTHDPNPVFPNELLTYTIVYTVYGVPAVGPVITDTLPPQVTFQTCDTDNGGSCAYNNGQVAWTWNSLIQDASGVVTAVVQAPATEWITLTNNYASDATSGPTYREGPPDLTYVGRPHLSITKRATTAVNPIAPGDFIIYSLTYTNAGSYKSTGTRVQDLVPVGTAYVAGSCAGAPCSESDGRVTWDLGEVPITTTGTLTMMVRVDPGAGSTTIVNNTYGIAADRNVIGENTPPAVNTIVVRPALSVNKTASPAWIALTGSVTYTIRYTNTGGGTFTTLHFTDTLDSRTAFQSASSNCANASNTVVCTDSNLAPGQSHQVTITVGNFGLSNGDVVTNAVVYGAANQTQSLPEAMTPPIEVPASNAGAAADFVGAPLSGSFPLAVTFTNLSSGSGIISYLWDFGDGTTSASGASTVPHSYNQTGVFTVSLTINTGLGSHTRTRQNYISVSGASVPGVSLTTSNQAKSGLLLQPVTYALNVQNAGNVPDSFTLSTSGNIWATIVAPASTGSLGAGSSATITVTVTVPNVAHNSRDFATVTATSVTSPAINSSLVLTTTAYDPAQGFSLQPAVVAGSGRVNNTVKYTLTITNTSLAADNFNLILSGNAWSTTVSSSAIGPLNFNSSAPIVVTVTIPSVTTGARDVVTITASSAMFPTVKRTSVLTTTVKFAIYLPLVRRS